MQTNARRLPTLLSRIRPLGQAFLLSIFVHGVLLVAVYPELPARLKLARNPLQATLLSRQPASVNGEEKVASPSIQSTSPDKEGRKRLSTQNSPVYQAMAGGSKALSTPASAQRRRAVESKTDALASGAGTSPEAEETTLDPEDLRHYRLALAIQSRRFKAYPASALAQAWEGRVEVELVFSVHVPVARSSIARSSGYPALDEQAVRMVQQAAQHTALPDGLRERNFRLILPIEFSFDDGRQ